MNIEAAAGIATAVAGTLGVFAKRWPAFPDHFIPIFVSVVGAIAFCANSSWTLANVFLGFLAGAASTGVNQTYRQIKENV